MLTVSMTIKNSEIPHLTTKETATNSADKNANVIQLALLLDTSGSMNGLIEQTKSQLWKITNELSTLRKKGNAPMLEIALYEYGSSSRAGLNDNWIRQISGFTTDMDKISEELFALNTGGSTELCGTVIQQSLQELEWTGNKGNLHLLYIAGNESFAQGQVPYQSAVAQAKKQDVIVNTIFCGDRQQGITHQWLNGAKLAGGEYANINHNQETVYVESPYDKQIADLNKKLNETYVYYGNEGRKYQDNQRKQDDNASHYGRSNMVERATFKSSSNYLNSSWDLVDAYEEDKDILSKKKVLPQELKDKSEKEVEAAILKKKQERSAIKQQIQSLSQERKQYLAERSKEKSEAASLENSIISSLKKQAAKKGFVTSTSQRLSPSAVDYRGFVELSGEVDAYRKQRMISLQDFIKMSKEPNTIILDTRSKDAYKGKHLKGAVHLNFSDFTEVKLAKVIPSKDTRILIYCNNNILNDPRSFAMKSMPLALNIPTFINLYGYGYKNIYELNSLVPVEHPSLEFEGKLVVK